MTQRRYPRRGGHVRPIRKTRPPAATSPSAVSPTSYGTYQPPTLHNTTGQYQQPAPAYPVTRGSGTTGYHQPHHHTHQQYSPSHSSYQAAPQPSGYQVNTGHPSYASQGNRRRPSNTSSDVMANQVQEPIPKTHFLEQAQPLAPLKVMNSHPKTLAWCPEEKGRNLFAIGSNQKHLTANFQSTISLEIVDANLNQEGTTMKIKGSLQYDKCFSKLAWGVHPDLDMGLLAGGMESGALTFWDPAKVANSELNSLFCVADTGHTEAITDVHFNPGRPNYLASASLDGKVLVWDVSDLSNITHTPAKIEDSSRPIWAVRWNTQVPYIIAAGNDQGQIFILDLKTERLVMTIRSGTSAIPNAIAWNPANAMEFAVAWKSGNPEIWDLRVAMKPTVTLQTSPNQEVRYLDWCPHDTSIIATASDDTICRIYNPHPKDHEQQLIHHFIFDDVNFICGWNPQHPGMLATSSVNGKVSLRSVNYTGPRHVPSWLKVKAGSQLGFGGKYIHFKELNEEKSPFSSLSMNNVPADPLILQLAQELQGDLVKIQKNEVPLQNLIQAKVEKAQTPEERTIWEMMILGFEPKPKRALVKYLGFKSEPLVDTPVVAATTPVSAEVMEPPRECEVESFFAQLSTTNLVGGKEEQITEKKEGLSDEKPADKGEASPKSTGVSDLSEEEIKIQKSLVFGDYQTAVDRSLKLGLFADALIFASHGGEKLWKQAQTAYFNSHKNTFVSQTMKAVMHGDLQSLVKKSDLSSWKETAAILLTYGSNNTSVLMRSLCDRLVNERHDYFAAVQTCLCSGDVDRMAGLLTKERQSRSNEKSSPETLHKSIEKVMLFSSLPKTCDLGGNEEVLKDSFAAYIDMLTSNGAVYEAYYILQSNIQILNSRRQKVSKDYEMMSNMLREALGLNRQQLAANQQAGQGYQKVDPGARPSPRGGVAGMRGPGVGPRRDDRGRPIPNGSLPANTSRTTARPGHHKAPRPIRHVNRATGQRPNPAVAGAGQPSNNMASGATTHTAPAFRSGVVGQATNPPMPKRSMPAQRRAITSPTSVRDSSRSAAPPGPVRSSSGYFGQHPAKTTSSSPPPSQQPMSNQSRMHAPQPHMQQQQMNPGMGTAPPRTTTAQHQAPTRRRPLRAHTGHARPRGY